MKPLAPARFGAVLLISLLVCIPEWESQAVPPLISSLSVAGTSLRINITSDVGITNQIQTTPDLSLGNWSVVTNVMVNQSNYWFNDTVSASGTPRFYRVLALPASNPNPGASDKHNMPSRTSAPPR